ncbi:Fc.00g043090.m01.CDS01 [Cosmosporella sp. VM-42]
MALTCLSGSIIANRFGLKATLVAGTTGYSIYSAALYTNNRYGNEWFIYVGSAACGITAGLFWAAEGAVMLRYPEPHNRGKYLAYWLCYRNSGSIVGGIINLPFNYKATQTGKLDWRTYIVFNALVLSLLSFYLRQIQSIDEIVLEFRGILRSLPELAERVPTLIELQALGRFMLRRELLLVAPYFIYVNWLLPYSSSYLFFYFSARARALVSLLSALAQIAGTALLGSFLDWDRSSLTLHARSTYLFLMALIRGCWVWGTVVQVDYSKNRPKLDCQASGGDGPFSLCGKSRSHLHTTTDTGLSGGFLGKLTKQSEISSSSAPLTAALGVNFALWGVALIPAWFTVRDVGVQ